MNARNKLNAASFNAIALLAGVIGFLTESWTVAFVTGFVLLASALTSGDIRRSKRR